MRRILLLLVLLGGPAMAVQPDEILDDPALEARAREISAGLRCPVCRNESIDESGAGVSRDLRLMVRERLLAGDTDPEVVEAVVARYGEYVLLKPDTTGANLALWLAPAALALAGLGIAGVAIRRRATAAPEADLSPEERAQLDRILKP